MSAESFRVDPKVIFDLADWFGNIADRLGQTIAVFSSNTSHHPVSVFGLFPAGCEVHRAYLQLADEAADGLRSFHSVGSRLAEDLRSSALNYIATDQHVANDRS